MPAVSTSQSSVANELKHHTASFIKLMPYVFGIVFLTVLAILVYQMMLAKPTGIVVEPAGLNRSEYLALDAVVSEFPEQDAFFTMPLPKLLDAVMAEKWVSEANIRRDWQRGIVVEALRREPVARFGSERLIDAGGVVFRPVNEQVMFQSQTVQNLALLQGEPEQAKLIMQQMLQINRWFAPLGLQVDDLILTPRMTWLVRFDNGLRVMVDNQQTNQKLMNLSQILQAQLNDRIDDMASVDLRYQNGFAIAWKTADTSDIVTLPTGDE